MSQLLEVKNLSVSFFTPQGEVQAVRNVSFSLQSGEVLAIVGESGCGKSVLCKSIMKLLPATAKIKSGEIRINDTDIAAYKEREMNKLRGKLFSMVFQDPMTSLNPTMTIGAQISVFFENFPKCYPQNYEIYVKIKKKPKLFCIIYLHIKKFH